MIYRIQVEVERRYHALDNASWVLLSLWASDMAPGCSYPWLPASILLKGQARIEFIFQHNPDITQSLKKAERLSHLIERGKPSKAVDRYSLSIVATDETNMTGTKGKDPLRVECLIALSSSMYGIFYVWDANLAWERYVSGSSMVLGYLDSMKLNHKAHTRYLPLPAHCDGLDAKLHVSFSRRSNTHTFSQQSKWTN